MHVLICTDGSPAARAAAEFARLIVQATRAEVTLLLVQETVMPDETPQRLLDELEALLAGASPRVERRVRRGHPDEEIMAETESRAYDLVVIGSRGRRGFTRFLLGSTAATLARYLRTPLLVVKERRASLERVLVCTGAEAPGEAAVRASRAIAGPLHAEVTVLHVMSQIPLTDEAPDVNMMARADVAMAQGTREGRHLRFATDLLQSTEGIARVTPKIREGLVVDEILAEVEEGDYDLLIIGAHQAPPDRRLGRMAGLLLDDIADQIISHARRPVLVVRAPPGR